MVMFKSDGARRDFHITKPRTVVGRTNTCDLRIPLSSVSREHCEILIVGNQVSVRDLESGNGTFLNNNRIKKELIEPGDELAIGPVVFTMVIDGDPDKIEPVRSLVDIPGRIAKPPSTQDRRPMDTTTKLDAEDSDWALEAITGSDSADESGELPMPTDDDSNA